MTNTAARPFRILLSAFACAPNSGSETGGGWHYALRLAQTHDVWVLTDISRREKIEREGGTLPARLRIHYFRPVWLGRVPLNSRTAHFIYQAWQHGAWRMAKQLDQSHDFDFCWHLTYGVFRQPSFMWKVGKPFIFGPVGGGERAPVPLRKSMPPVAKFKEGLRDIVNSLCWLHPGLKATYRHARLVIARTDDTRKILPASVQDRTVVQQEIGGYAARVRKTDRNGHDGNLRIVFVGRLLALKGIHLAIPAFARFLSAGGQGEFTIIGDGPMAAHLRRQTERLGVSRQVHFVGNIPQPTLFEEYPKFDLLLFPSLRDSGGNAVIEALSFGLPVICLDLGGPKCFVDESCGIVVKTNATDEDAVIDRLTRALADLHRDSSFHKRLCDGAIDRAQEVTWENQISRVLGQISRTLPPNTSRLTSNCLSSGTEEEVGT